MEQKILKENVYSYKWIENESKISNFIPDCIVEINGKVLAIEIFVTHFVDKEKENKVRNNKINMLEIDLTDIVEQINNENFDIEKYILFDAIRW